MEMEQTDLGAWAEEQESAAAEPDGASSERAESRPRRRWSPAQRAAHAKRRKLIDGARADLGKDGRTPRSAPATASVDLVAKEVIDTAVANVKGLCLYLAPFAPYAAITLMGAQDESGAELVRSRAEMAGRVLLRQAENDPRIVRAVARFNRLFESVEAVEVIGAVGASVAVDAKLVDPHLRIRYGPVEFPILEPVIGDTIAFIDAQKEAQGVMPTPERVEPVPREESTAARGPYPGQHGTAVASASVRREGQMVVPGGVEDT